VTEFLVTIGLLLGLAGLGVIEGWRFYGHSDRSKAAPLECKNCGAPSLDDPCDYCGRLK
jgi:hypothetical protein